MGEIFWATNNNTNFGAGFTDRWGKRINAAKTSLQMTNLQIQFRSLLFYFNSFCMVSEHLNGEVPHDA